MSSLPVDALRVVVHGRVQGVGFRYAARAQAERLGITGWVRNRTDGAVECEIAGDQRQLDAMLDWLSHGPPAARVTSVESAPLPHIDQLTAHDSTFRITA